MSQNRRHFTEVGMDFTNLIDELQCSTDEFYNALVLYLEVNREDFMTATGFWIKEWRKPLQDTDIIVLNELR